MTTLPTSVTEVIEIVGALPGVVAVVLGGSRALGTSDPGTDWDLGLYYRSTIDLSPLAAFGTIHPPGSWGRIMNGGAWLTRGSERIDVLLRDLDVVDHWTRLAERGQFERDALLGYLAGIPTYVLTAELASGQTLAGALPPPPRFPARLAEAAPPVWRFCRSFSLDYARIHARRGNVAGAVGQAAAAAMEEAHAILCERGEWICNEKRLLAAAGLGSIQGLFPEAPAEPEALVGWVDRIAAALQGARPLAVRSESISSPAAP
ncbi:MAG: nucleotidyltransferase domain-containing protein [Gemmatimonadetes bacterium]|nr:nucleotidyltransferase domain-containing protein [Gemmatimonadota bacterium]